MHAPIVILDPYQGDIPVVVEITRLIIWPFVALAALWVMYQAIRTIGPNLRRVQLTLGKLFEAKAEGTQTDETSGVSGGRRMTAVGSVGPAQGKEETIRDEQAEYPGGE